jgi:hypothetical protein
MIKFAVSRAEEALIESIIDRAVASGNCDSPMSTRMDLCAVQNSSTPLDLRRMLDADDFNFAHDLFGIARHLDRRDNSPTGGELLNCFLPRFAVKAQGPLPGDPKWLRARIHQRITERGHHAA